MLAQHVITTAESVLQQLKLCRRRLPQDIKTKKIGFSDVETLKACQPLVTKVSAVINHVSKLTVPLVTASGGKMIHIYKCQSCSLWYYIQNAKLSLSIKHYDYSIYIR